MRLLLIGILFLGSLPSSAQILDNTHCNLFSSEPFFNERFVRENKIREIRGEYSIKKNNLPIKQLGMQQAFRFDTKGRLITQWETFYRKGGKLDTTVVMYYYNDQGLVAEKVSTDHYGWVINKYDYDPQGRLVKEQYCRDENGSIDKLRFKSTRELVIKTETYQYRTPGKGQEKKLVLNNSGRNYKEQMKWKDENGQVKEMEEVYTITRKGINVKYTYDEEFRVKSREQRSSLGSKTNHFIEYSYDNIGNIEEEKITRDGKLKTLIQYLYQPNMLLKARLLKDELTHNINIIEYSYQFFD